MATKRAIPDKGNILTAKGLPAASYNAIHDLPHGLRRMALHAVLAATGELAKEMGPDWYEQVLSKGKKLKLSLR